MLIAIPADNGRVSMHFGHCAEFVLYEIEGDKVMSKRSVDNPGHEPGVLPKFLAGFGVDCVIAGGMGSRAQALFAEHGIDTVTGADGKTDEIAEQFARGTLEGSENACSHLRRE